MELTLKQRRFVAYYLGEANGNSIQAARLAGYSQPDKQCSQVLGSSRVKSAIEAGCAEIMGKGEVLARLADQACADMAHYGELVGADPKDAKAILDKLRKQGLSRRIKKLVPTKQGLSVELHDSQAALVRLGMYHGLWAEKITLDLQGHDLADLPIDELLQIARGKAPDRLAQSSN